MLFTQRPVAATTLLAAALFPSAAVAQLVSLCNPIKGQDCPPNPALGTSHTFDFNQSQPSGMFKNEASAPSFDPTNFGSFTIKQQGQSVTYVSNFYFFWGRTEIIMKAAPGQGIVSSIVWKSDILDEVDWELLGSRPNYVTTNYFGRGNQNFNNGGNVTIPGSIQTDWHNYTTVWTKDRLEWWLDNNLIRTLLPQQATDYPQTPMQLSLGIWAGGDPKLNPPGTVEWAGGETDFSQAPFTMYIKSVHVDDFSGGKEYSYGDHSGTWQSIRIAEGNSSAADTLNQPPSQTTSEKFNALSPGAKNGIYAGAASFAVLIIAAALWYCIKKRNQGKRELALADERGERERMELERWKQEGKDPDVLAFDGADAATVAKGTNVTATYSVPHDPDSPPGSSHGPAQSAWDATGSAGPSGGVGGPNVPGSAGVAPAGYAAGGLLRQQNFDDDHMRSASPAISMASPMNSPPSLHAPQMDSYAPLRTQSPAISPGYPMPGSPAQPPARIGSPAVGQGNGQSSPNSIFTPMPGGVPARSMTASPGGNPNFAAPPPRSMTASPAGYGGGYGAQINTGYEHNNGGYGGQGNSSYEHNGGGYGAPTSGDYPQSSSGGYASPNNAGYPHNGGGYGQPNNGGHPYRG